jgi:hypothetical protein
MRRPLFGLQSSVVGRRSSVVGGNGTTDYTDFTDWDGATGVTLYAAVRSGRLNRRRLEAPSPLRQSRIGRPPPGHWDSEALPCLQMETIPSLFCRPTSAQAQGDTTFRSEWLSGGLSCSPRQVPWAQRDPCRSCMCTIPVPQRAASGPPTTPTFAAAVSTSCQVRPPEPCSLGVQHLGVRVAGAVAGR